MGMSVPDSLREKSWYTTASKSRVTCKSVKVLKYEPLVPGIKMYGTELHTSASENGVDGRAVPLQMMHRALQRIKMTSTVNFQASKPKIGAIIPWLCFLQVEEMTDLRNFDLGLYLLELATLEYLSYVKD